MKNVFTHPLCGGASFASQFTGVSARLSLLLLTLLLGVCTPALAQKTWDGGAGTTSWGDANNWNPNVIPATNEDVVIDPTGGGSLSITNVPTITLGSFTLGGGNNTSVTLNAGSAVTVTITGNAKALTFTGTGTHVIGANITLVHNPTTANANVAYNSTGLDVYGAITASGAFSTFTQSTVKANLRLLEGSIITSNTTNTTAPGIPNGTWNKNATLRVRGVTTQATVPTNANNQNFGYFYWECAQTARINLGVTSAFGVQSNMDIVQTSSTNNATNSPDINNQGGVGNYLVLYSGSLASNQDFNIGGGLSVGGGTAQVANFALNNGTGAGTITFNVGANLTLRNNVSGGANFCRFDVAINTQPCSLVVEGVSTGTHTFNYRVSNPEGGAVNVVAWHKGGLTIGTGSSGAGQNFNLGLIRHGGSLARSNNSSTLIVGSATKAADLTVTERATFAAMNPNGTQNNNTAVLRVFGNLNYVNSSSTAATFIGMNTTATASTGNSFTMDIKKVNGNFGDFYVATSSSNAHNFELYPTSYLGTNGTATLNVEGTLYNTGNSNFSPMNFGAAGANNLATLNIGHFFHNPVGGNHNLLSASSASGTNRVVVNARRFTVRGNTLNGNSFNAASAGNILRINVAEDFTILGGFFVLSNLGATVAANVNDSSSLNILGNYYQAGGSFNVNNNNAAVTSTTNYGIARIYGTFRITGGTLNLIGGNVSGAGQAGQVGRVELSGNAEFNYGLITASVNRSDRPGVIRFMGTNPVNWTGGNTAFATTGTGAQVRIEVPQAKTITLLKNYNSTLGGLTKLSLATGATLKFGGDDGQNWTFHEVNGTGTFDLRGKRYNLIFADTTTFSSLLTDGSGSSVSYINSASINVVGNVTYENLNIQDGTKTFTGTSVNVTKDLRVNTATTLNLPTSAFTATIDGTLLASYGTTNLVFGNSTNTQSITVGGRCVGPGSLVFNFQNQTNKTLTLRGSENLFTTSNTTNSTVIYDRQGDQLVAPTTYFNLTIDGSGNKIGRHSSNIVVNNRLNLLAGSFGAMNPSQSTPNEGQYGNRALQMGNGSTIARTKGALILPPFTAATTDSVTLEYNGTVIAGYESQLSTGVIVRIRITGDDTVTLGNNVTIGSATLAGKIDLGSNGKLALGGYVLIHRGTSTTGSLLGTFGAANSYILTNGIGRYIRQDFTSAAAYSGTYPFAVNNNGTVYYSPLTLSFSAGTAPSAGFVFDVEPTAAPAIGTNSLNKHFVFRVNTTTDVTGLTGTVAFGFDAAEAVGNVASYQGYFMNLNGGSNWGLGSASSQAITGSGPYTVTFTYSSATLTNAGSGNNMRAIYTAAESSAIPANIYFSRASTNASSPSTWSTGGFSGLAAGSAPGASDFAIIGNGNTVIATNNFQVAQLTLEGSYFGSNIGAISFGNAVTGVDLGVVRGGGVIRFANGSNNTTPLFPTVAANSPFFSSDNGTVEYGGTAAYTLPTRSEYGSLYLNVAAILSGPASAITVNGEIRMVGGGTFQPSNNVVLKGSGITSGTGSATYNQTAGTLRIEGPTNAVINLGTVSTTLNLNNIWVDSVANLYLTGTGGSVLNITGNMDITTKRGRGFALSGYNVTNFNGTSTINAPFVTLVLGAVNINDVASVTLNGSFSLRGSLTNNGSFNQTAGSFYMGCQNCLGTDITRTGGTPTTVFNNLLIDAGNAGSNILKSITVNNDFIINNNQGGSNQVVQLPSNGTNLTLNLKNVFISGNTFSVNSSLSANTSHTINITGDVYQGVNMTLWRTGSGFTSQATLNFTGSADKKWSSIGSYNNSVYGPITFTAGCGKVTIVKKVDAGNDVGEQFNGNITMNSSNDVVHVVAPGLNNYRLNFGASGLTINIGGSGTGRLVLPNVTVNGGATVNQSRNVYYNGIGSGNNDNATRGMFGVAATGVFNHVSDTAFFTGGGSIVNTDGSGTSFNPGTGTVVLNTSGTQTYQASRLLASMQFYNLNLLNSIELDATNLALTFLAGGTVNTFTNTFIKSNNQAQTVTINGTFNTAHPGGLFNGNGGLSATFVSSNNTTTVTVASSSSVNFLAVKGGVFNIAQITSWGNVSVGNGTDSLTLTSNNTASTTYTINGNLNINNNANLAFGAGLNTVTVNGNVTGAGRLNMTGNGHSLTINGNANTLSDIITDNVTTAGLVSTVTYAGSGAQSIIPSLNYRNLTLSSASTLPATMSGAVRANQTLTINRPVALGNFDFTLGSSIDQPGTLSITGTAGFVTVGTGRFFRYFSSNVVQSTTTNEASRFPFLTTSGQDRSAYIYFNSSNPSSNSLAGDGLVGLRHDDQIGLSVISPNTPDNSYVLQNRSKSKWIATVTTTPTLASGVNIVLALQGNGAVVPTDDNAADNMRIVQLGSPITIVGTNLVNSASTAAAPQPRRTLSSFSLLTGGDFVIAGNSADLPNNFFNSVTSGSWDDPNTWDVVAVPNALAAVVIINNGHDVSLASDRQANSVNVLSGGTLTASTYTIQLASSTTNTISGTLKTAKTAASAISGSTSSTFDNSTNSPAATVTLGSSSSVEYDGAGAQTVQALNYNNLTVSGTNRSGNVTVSGSVGIAGTFNPSATFTGGNGFLTSGSTFTFNGGSTQTIPVFTYNNVTVTNTAGITLASGTINITGTFTPGSAAYTTTGNTVDYSGSGPVSVGAINYNNLTISTAGTVNMPAGTVGITGAFTPSSSATYNLNSGTVSYNGTGAQTITNFNYHNLVSTNTGTRTLQAAGVGIGQIGVAGSFANGSNAYTTAGSYLNYNGTTSQTITGPFTYGSLGITGARVSGTITMGAFIFTITDTLNITTTGTYAWSQSNNADWFFNNASSTQNIRISPSVAFRPNRITFIGAGIKRLFANLSCDNIDLSTGINQSVVQLNNFNLEVGSASNGGSWVNSTFNSAGVITNGTGALRIWYLPASGGFTAVTPNNNNFHRLFPIRSANGQRRHVVVRSSSNAPISSAGYISIRYVDGVGIAVAPNSASSNGVSVNRITNGYWKISTNIGSLSAPLMFDFVTNGMYTMSGLGSDTSQRVVYGFDPAPPTSITSQGGRNNAFKPSVNAGNYTNYLNGVTGNNFVSTSLLTLSQIGSTIADSNYFIGSNNAFFQTVYLSNASGNWNSSSSWSPTGVPGIGDNVTVQSAHTITLTQDEAVNQLTVSSGGTLNTSTFVLSLGTTTTASQVVNGTLRSARTQGLFNAVNTTFGNILPNVFTFGSNSTVDFSSASSQVINFGSSISDRANVANITNTGNGPRTLQGTILISGSYSPGSGVITPGSSTVEYNGSLSQTITPSRYNNLTRSGTSPVVFGTDNTNNNGVIAISGGLSIPSAPITIGASTIEFNGTGAQTIPALSYNNLVVSGDRGGATITVSNLATVAINNTFNSTVSNANFSVAGTTFDFTNTGSQTIPQFNYNNITNSGNGDRTFGAGTVGVAGSLVTGSGAISFDPGSVVNFNGAGSQTIINLAYRGLTISGARTSNNVTLPSGTLTVSGDLINSATFSGGAILPNGGTVDLTSGGAQTVTGMVFNNLTNSGNGNRTFTGIVSIAGSFTRSSGTYTTTGSTVDYNGAGAQSIAALNYNSLTVSGNRGGGAITFSSDVASVAGNFVVTASNLTTTVAPSIDFNGAAQSAQNVWPGGFNYIRFSNSGTKSFNAPLNINNNGFLVLGQGTTFNNTTNNATMGTGATLLDQGGAINIAPIFGGAINVEYTASATTGLELPNTPSQLSKLRVNVPSGTITLASGVEPIISDSLNIMAGSLNINNAGRLRVNGFIGGAGTITGGNSAKLYLGGNTATTSTLRMASGNSTLDSLVVTRTGGGNTNLGAPLTIRTGLVFGGSAQSNITTGTDTLFLGANATIAGEANGRYVRGLLRVDRTVSNSTVSTNFGGMGVLLENINSQNMGNIRMVRVSGPGSFRSGENGNQSINRNWKIKSQFAGTQNVQVTFNWISDDDNYVTPPALARVFKSTDGGATWEIVYGVFNFADRYQIIQTSSFSEWTVADAENPLPVTLLSLAANKARGAVELKWTTATEQNSRYFEMQRSVDGKTFETISTVEAAGNSQVRRSYQYLDLAASRLLQDKLYYRLRMVSDDQDELSGAVVVSFDEVRFDAKAQPNPFHDKLFLNIDAKQGPITIELIDALGMVVKSELLSAEGGNLRQSVEGLGNLPAGLYTLRLTQGDSMKMLKVTKD